MVQSGECLPSMHKAPGMDPSTHEWGRVARIYNPKMEEVELCLGWLEARLDYMRPVSKHTNVCVCV